MKFIQGTALLILLLLIPIIENAMEPINKKVHLIDSNRGPARLFELASMAAIKNAGAYDPLQLMEHYSFLIKIKNFEDVLKKMLDVSAYGAAQDVYQNYQDAEKLHNALLQPLSNVINDYPKHDDSKNIAAQIALNAIEKVVRKKGPIINIDADPLFKTLVAFDKYLPYGENHFFAIIRDQLIEFKKYEETKQIATRKCEDARIVGNKLYVKNPQAHLLVFKKNENCFLNKRNPLRSDIGLVGKNGQYCLLDDDENVIIFNRNKELRVWKNCNPDSLRYSEIQKNIYASETLLSKKNIVAIATNYDAWIWRWNGSKLQLECEIDLRGKWDNIEQLPLPNSAHDLKIAETGNLILINTTNLNNTHKTNICRYADGHWHNTELRHCIVEDDQLPIQSIEILTESEILGIIKLSDLHDPMLVSYSWIDSENSWQQLNGFKMDYLDFYTSQYDNPKLAVLKQDRTISVYTKKNQVGWQSETNNKKHILDFHFTEDGRHLIGLTANKEVLLLEFNEGEWFEILSPPIDDLYIPLTIQRAVAHEAVTDNPHLIPIALTMLQDKEFCKFASGGEDIAFMKTMLDNALYMFQHNRLSNQLNLVSKTIGGNISVYRDAFLSNIKWNDDIYTQETQNVLAQVRSLTS